MQPKTAKRRSAFRRANRTMPRRRIDIATEAIDYKNPDLLKKFVTESGKILPRRITGMPAHLHRRITREIKRSRSVLMMKYGVHFAPPSRVSMRRAFHALQRLSATLSTAKRVELRLSRL